MTRAPLLALLALLALPLAGCGADALDVAHQEALAALRDGDLARALEAAERAAEAEPTRGRPLLDFVRGSAAFARSRATEPPGVTSPAEAAALEQSLVLAEDALAFWQRAATSRADWPAARRNVERALLRLEALAARRPARSEPGRRIPVVIPGPGTEPGSGPETPPEPPPGPGPGEEAPAEAVTADLSPEALARLGEVLRAKEREKQAARRARWAAPARTAERDW